jgi:hypothetical protein
VSQHKVGKRSFDADLLELAAIALVDLNAQREAEHERGDARQKAGQERVEWESADQQTVDELNDSGGQNIAEICVHDLQSRGRVLHVTGAKLAEHSANRRHSEAIRVQSTTSIKCICQLSEKV